MRFLIDENVRREVSEFLATIGDAKYVPRGASDKSVARIAQTKARILITHDKDFINPITYPPSQYVGIIVIRIHPPVFAIINDALSRLFSYNDEKILLGRIVILGTEGFLISPSPDL